MTQQVLYSFRRCPYAMRARMALSLAEIDYEHREVSLREKPSEMLDASPKGSVPVFIKSDGSVLDESLDILRWALPKAELQTDLIEIIDGPFKHHLDRYKYWSRYDDTAQRGDINLDHRAEAVRLLRVLDNALEDQDFLSGPEMGPTDIATFPFIRQFAAVEPNWWGNDSGLDRLRDWLAQCLNSELFKSVMTKHPLWSTSFAAPCGD